jgi:hypothetical protein
MKIVLWAVRLCMAMLVSHNRTVSTSNIIECSQCTNTFERPEWDLIGQWVKPSGIPGKLSSTMLMILICHPNRPSCLFHGVASAWVGGWWKWGCWWSAKTWRLNIRCYGYSGWKYIGNWILGNRSKNPRCAAATQLKWKLWFPLAPLLLTPLQAPVCCKRVWVPCDHQLDPFTTPITVYMMLSSLLVNDGV